MYEGVNASEGIGIGTVAAVLLVIGFVYLLFRPYHESTTLKVDLKMKKGAMAK